MYSVEQATLNAVKIIRRFIENEGRNLCIASGYSPINVTMGVNVGVALVICDSIKVRTSGTVVNEAKRLQEAAPHGKSLAKSSVFSKSVSSEVFGPEFPILIKSNLIMACEIKINELELDHKVSA